MVALKKLNSAHPEMANLRNIGVAGVTHLFQPFIVVKRLSVTVTAILTADERYFRFFRSQDGFLVVSRKDKAKIGTEPMFSNICIIWETERHFLKRSEFDICIIVKAIIKVLERPVLLNEKTP